MELKTYTCPNCGATTTNAENCEYCGSLLVRFEAKGISAKNMSYYFDESKLLPGLVDGLEKHLKLQEMNSDEGVITDIILPVQVFKEPGVYMQGKALQREYCVLSSKDCFWSDGVEAFVDADDEQLAIAFEFPKNCDDKYNASYYVQAHEKFKKMDCYDLFLHRKVRDGNNKINDEYCIDFGPDAVGAAHLISHIINELDGEANAMNATYETNFLCSIDIDRQCRYESFYNEYIASSLERWYKDPKVWLLVIAAGIIGAVLAIL